MENKTKKFWQKPENYASIAIGGSLAIFAGWGLMTILPALILLATNTIILGVMVVGIASVCIAAWENRTLIRYSWKSIMRWLAGRVIEMDPIGIMRNYALDLKGHLGNMEDQIKNLRVQMRHLQERITANDTEYQHCMQMADQARQQSNHAIFTVQSRQAGRLETSNNQLKDVFAKMEQTLAILTKFHTNSECMIQDLEGEIKVQSEKREALFAASSAMASARSIMIGQPDQRALFDQALEITANDYAQRVGEIEDFMSTSATLIQTADLQNGVYEAETMKKLEAMDLRADALLAPPAGKMLEYNPTEAANFDRNGNKVAIPAKRKYL